MSRYAEVVVPLPVPGRFHYRVPDELQDNLRLGHRVLVPFGTRKVTAFVLALTDELGGLDEAKLKAILARLDAEPLLPADVLELARFAADYYLATPGEVLKVALPPGLTAASKKRLTTTALGRAALDDDLDDATRALLLAGLKAGLKGKLAKSRLALKLVEGGWLSEHDEVGAKESGDEIWVVERLVDRKTAWPHLGRARNRLRLFERVEAEPVPLEVLKAELGDGLRAALKHLEVQGILQTKKAPRPTTLREDPVAAAPRHTAEQEAALLALLPAIEARAGGSFLLHGVTGSGKTEVYLAAIERGLALGQGAIVLVPEIALTPQLEQRFRARFGEQVVVLHSGIADGERRRRWQQLRSGEAKIALGARSALWAPVRDLGVVVVDEEHDPSFKQGSEVRYHGRDLALVRARQTKSVAILGSATPSLESLELWRQGRLTRLVLGERALGRPMPTIQVVDLAAEKKALKGAVHILSRPLADRLRAVVAAKQQAILFLNRRGFNTIVYCEGCGDARRCSHCDVSLTHHRAQNELHCHYCGHLEPLSAPCRKCGSPVMEPFGVGTERLVEAVEEEVQGVKVLRLDRDSTSKVGSLEATLSAFRAGEADVLVGTQMVAKGHDFPRVTLVGIILADASLAFPDFRAAERTFQLLTQVAGRAGRAEDPGHVIIQTFQPDHYALQAAIAHDALAFHSIESPSRAAAGYPPHTRLGLVRIEARDQNAAKKQAERVARLAKEAAGNAPVYRVIGPAPAPIEKLRDRYRQLVLTFAPTPARLQALLFRVKQQLGRSPAGVDVVFDVDALDLL